MQKTYIITRKIQVEIKILKDINHIAHYGMIKKTLIIQTLKYFTQQILS